MANVEFGCRFATEGCRPSFSPCTMTGTAVPPNTLSDLELYMKGLAATCVAQRQVLGCDSYNVWPAQNDTSQALQHAAYETNGGPSVPYPYNYQSLLAGLPLRKNASNSMVSFPCHEMLTNQRSVTRSNKLKEKIRQLHPFYSRRLTSAAPQEGRTRTRDKYRVVYSEKQRIGLEKAYKEDKFITMAKKTELSKTLALSDRQIKIWFQNRRAKERRDKKKHLPDTHTVSKEMDTIVSGYSMHSENSSCRFQEKENAKPCEQLYIQGYPSLQMAVQPINPMSNCNKYGGHIYDQSLMAQPIRSHMETEVAYKYQDCAHARSQMSPSDWLGATFHLDSPVNVSPFTSSLSVTSSYRT